MARYGIDYGYGNGWNAGMDRDRGYDADHGRHEGGFPGGMNRPRRPGGGAFSGSGQDHGSREWTPRGGYGSRGWNTGGRYDDRDRNARGRRDWNEGVGYRGTGYIPDHLPARRDGGERGYGVRGSNLPGGSVRGRGDFGFGGGYGQSHGREYDHGYRGDAHGGPGGDRGERMRDGPDDLRDRVREGWRDVRRGAREMFRR
jgi:hypothetical protein